MWATAVLFAVHGQVRGTEGPRTVAFLNTMVNLLPDMHAVERDSWQACCSRCVPTVLATPDAAFPPSCTYLRASMLLLLPMSMTSTPSVCLMPLHMSSACCRTVPICWISSGHGKTGTIRLLYCYRRRGQRRIRQQSADRPHQEGNSHEFP